MFYTFKNQRSTPTSYSLNDYFNNSALPIYNNVSFETHTTIEKDTPPNNVCDINTTIQYLANNATPFNENMENYYTEFKIPKAKGGYRTINAPNEQLKTFQKQVLAAFKVLHILPHNAAHAYVEHRSCATALEVHQNNQSNWFLKIDLKDFFGSCTLEWVYQQLKKIYPFSLLTEENNENLKKILRVCSLHNALPQGAPTSPLLTNLIMVPIDYVIYKELGNSFRYTRYADDMLISSRVKFNPTQVIRILQNVLKETPLRINNEKTHFKSKAGANWNLGLMLNKDNQITIGHEHKRTMRAKINNFLSDLTNNQIWSIIEVQRFLGLLQYYINIEPNYWNTIICKYNQKYRKDLMHEIKQILK